MAEMGNRDASRPSNSHSGDRLPPTVPLFPLISSSLATIGLCAGEASGPHRHGAFARTSPDRLSNHRTASY